MTTSTELGEKILVIVENCQDCVEQLRTIVAHIPDAPKCRFTLLHCCPPKYWEHGASPESQREARKAWQTTESELSESEFYLRSAKNLLMQTGILASQITIRLAVNETLESAVITELRQGQYSGIVLCSDHSKLIQWASGRVIMRRFSKLGIQTFEPQSYSAATL